MARRAQPPGRAREPIFGPPATTPEAAFVRFGNALHWEVYSSEIDGVDHGSAKAFLAAVLARMKRAEHRLVAAFIAELTGGGYTFSEARAIWKRSQGDQYYIVWDDPAAFLRFLLVVRDTIDPHAWPASPPRFRPEPGGAGVGGAASRKPVRRPR